jgi:hypothetical protein
MRASVQVFPGRTIEPVWFLKLCYHQYSVLPHHLIRSLYVSQLSFLHLGLGEWFQLNCSYGHGLMTRMHRRRLARFQIRENHCLVLSTLVDRCLGICP